MATQTKQKLWILMIQMILVQIKGMLNVLCLTNCTILNTNQRLYGSYIEYYIFIFQKSVKY